MEAHCHLVGQRNRGFVAHGLYCIYQIPEEPEPRNSDSRRAPMKSGSSWLWSLGAPFPFCEIRLRWTRNTRKKSDSSRSNPLRDLFVISAKASRKRENGVSI